MLFFLAQMKKAQAAPQYILSTFWLSVLPSNLQMTHKLP